MSGYIRLWRWSFPVLVAILVVSPAISQGALANDVVQALIDAQNRQDLAAMRALVAPNTAFVVDPGMPNAINADFDEYYREPLPSIQVTSMQETAPGVIEVTATASGGAIPALPNPYTYTATYTVQDGQVTAFTATLSDQTRADLAAAQTPVQPPAAPAPAQPAPAQPPVAPAPAPAQVSSPMPVTGRSSLALPLAVLACLLMAAGLRMRRMALAMQDLAATTGP